MPTLDLHLDVLSLLRPAFMFETDNIIPLMADTHNSISTVFGFRCEMSIIRRACTQCGWVFSRGGFSSCLWFIAWTVFSHDYLVAFMSSTMDSSSQFCQPEFGSTRMYVLFGSPAEIVHLRFSYNFRGPSTDVHSLRRCHSWHLLDRLKWIVEVVYMSSTWTDWDINTFTPILWWENIIFPSYIYSLVYQ